MVRRAAPPFSVCLDSSFMCMERACRFQIEVQAEGCDTSLCDWLERALQAG